MKLWKIQVSIMHYARLPYQTPPTQENNPAQPLGRLNPSPQQNWKP
jgi:hypothetical protein